MLPLTYSTLPSTEIQRLETLTLCPKKNQTEKHCSSCMMMSSSVIVSSSATTSDSYLFFGDYIGMESCVDLDSNFYINYNEKACVGGGRTKTKTRTKKKIERTEFPPPISSLAHAENLHSPWVLKRYYTGDGRLVLREEKARRHEYFRATRSNGRLTLQLVAPSINGEDEDDGDDQKAQLIDVLDITNNNAEDDGHEKGQSVGSSYNSTVNCSPIAETTPIENGSAAKCLNYASVRPNPSCFLRLPVPAVRPVRT